MCLFTVVNNLAHAVESVHILMMSNENVKVTIKLKLIILVFFMEYYIIYYKSVLIIIIIIFIHVLS